MGAKLSTAGHPIVGAGAQTSSPIDQAESALARHSTPPVGITSSNVYEEREQSLSASNGDLDADAVSVSSRDMSTLSQPSQTISNLMSFSFFRSNSTSGHHPHAHHQSRDEEGQVEEPLEYHAHQHHHHHHRRSFASDAGGLSSSVGSTGSAGTSAPAATATTGASTERGLFLDFPVTMRRIMLSAQSLPASMWAVRDVKCPVCEALIPHDDVERHLIMCLTRPRVQYNDETLVDNKGECVICLEDMEEGHVIARLPCLCIYHKQCIQAWFRHKDACPTHPDS